MSRRNPQREAFYDILTFILVLASVVVLGGSLLIAGNPDVPFNPFPPPTEPPRLAQATFTPSVTFTPSITPTYTPSQTLTPSITPTYTPSLTPTITDTPTPSNTPTPSSTPTATYTPVLPGLPTSTPDAATPVSGDGAPAQPGIVIPPTTDPLLEQNQDSAVFPFSANETIFQRNTNDRACDWLSIAGNVTGLQGEPVLNLPVEVAGEGFLEVRFTGTASEFGAAGFEVNLGNRPVRERYSVRLLGAAGEPLSDFIFVTTVDTCDRNVAVVEFVQVRE